MEVIIFRPYDAAGPGPPWQGPYVVIRFNSNIDHQRLDASNLTYVGVRTA